MLAWEQRHTSLAFMQLCAACFSCAELFPQMSLSFFLFSPDSRAVAMLCWHVVENVLTKMIINVVGGPGFWQKSIPKENLNAKESRFTRFLRFLEIISIHAYKLSVSYKNVIDECLLFMFVTCTNSFCTNFLQILWVIRGSCKVLLVNFCVNICTKKHTCMTLFFSAIHE